MKKSTQNELAIDTIYTLFLKWGFELISYKNETYFVDTLDEYPTQKCSECLYLDRFASQYINNFLHRYKVTNKSKEQKQFADADSLYVFGVREP